MYLFLSELILNDRNHRSAGESPISQIIESFVRIMQRIEMYLRSHRHLRRERKKLLAVASGKVRDRFYRALLPQDRVWERRYIAHVNPGTDHYTALRDSAQSRRHETLRTLWS